VANGVLLPFVVVYMLLLVNRPRLMGTYTNRRWQNAIAWLTAVTMIIISTIMVISILAG
jgi:Mn2+/Fe2+ NRAMP family transporter